MPKDFANKPTNGTAAPKQSSKALWLKIITGLLLVGFSTSLYFLTQVPTNTTNANAVRQQLNRALEEPNASKSNSTSSLPKNTEPKKTFEFYELLQKDEVSVDLPNSKNSTNQPTSIPTNPNPQEKQRSIDGNWTLQVASFSTFSDADKVRARLILNGLSKAHIKSVNVPGKGYYHRVFVGPITEKNALHQTQKTLKEMNFNPIVRTQ